MTQQEQFLRDFRQVLRRYNVELDVFEGQIAFHNSPIGPEPFHILTVNDHLDGHNCFGFIEQET